MPCSLNRREFIKTASLIGASALIENSPSAKTFLYMNDKNEIKNNYFTVSFDPAVKKINIYRINGTPLLLGGTSCVNFPAGPEDINIVKQSVSSGNYKNTYDSAVLNDRLGTGKRLRIFSKDLNEKLDFETYVSLYDSLQIITVELICRNVSGNDIIIQSLEPLRVIKDEGGYLNVPDVSKCITNGEMYYDAGLIHEFDPNNKAGMAGEIKGIKLSNKFISSDNETVHSWWNAGLFSGYEKEGIAIGYLENNLCLGNLLISKTDKDQISFLSESVYMPELVLKPGKTISSNRLMIILAANTYKALEDYAAAVGGVNNARKGKVINGWCSWFYTLANVSEEEVISNAEFASKYLKQYGLEYIQIDEGYQRWHGDWEGNDRFPHGMKWLADKIKSYGFKAGLWISPYVISETTKVFKEHPEWLLKNRDGSLKRIGNWEDEIPDWAANEYPKRYCLDSTHPGAAEWLHDLFDTVANRWGYEMIKIDFMAWSILASDHYYDPAVSSAQVYRRGLEIMRNAVGVNCHILECGPGQVTVGLIDSMRIEADINYGYMEAAWKTYFQDPACSAAAAAKRYYFHKRTWINDADHICMNLLNDRQSEAAATIIALSGGNMISGDRLIQLDTAKIEILKKITPSYGAAAAPADLFDSEIPSVFVLKVKKEFDDWSIIGFFNSSLTETIEKRFSLKRLWLEPGKTYLAFDFWKQQFFGEVSHELKVTVEPGSVVLLTVHEKSGKPQFLSTDRHITQGGIEIESIKWDETSKTLTGISVGSLNTSHNVSIYVPGEHPWIWGGYVLFRDYDSYSLKLVHNNIIQVHVRFEKNEKVNWEINAEEFFK